MKGDNLPENLSQYMKENIKTLAHKSVTKIAKRIESAFPSEPLIQS